MKRILAIALGIALVGQSARAQLLTDNFNNENGGVGSLGYNAFANWTVVGSVDLVQSGTFGITCAGLCIDLAGTPGPGAIRTINTYAFNPGDVMTFSFDVSGNQRSGGNDPLFLRLLFGQNTPFASAVGTGGFTVFTITSPGTFASNALLLSPVVEAAAPFSNWSFSFTAATSGSLAYELGTSRATNEGPIVDNIVISRSSTVPEPSTWALMAAGLGAIALVARRRPGRNCEARSHP